MPAWIKYKLLYSSYWPLAIEVALVLAVLLLAWKTPMGLHQWAGRVERRLSALSRMRWTSVTVIFILALSLRAAFIPFAPPGIPEVHDEFSYLLAADTFASGRLTNPTHPHWPHFESMHVIHQPSYQSKYPPGQGLVLAAGMILADNPWVGVWLSCALMCAALCWMLQGWLPPPTALVGGLLIVVRFCTVHDWSTGYWGGAVAATGGALALGALARIMWSKERFQGLVLGLGLVILASSRPFEGMVLGVGVAVVLLVWMFRQRGLASAAKQVALPVALVLALGAVLTTHYFKAVTGDRLTMPYQLHLAAYEAARPFFWQTPDLSKSYQHEDLEKYWIDYHLERFENSKQAAPALIKRRVSMVWFDMLWPGLVWSLLFLPFAMRDSKSRALLFLGISIPICLIVESQMFLHYLAPMVGLWFALALVGMQRFRQVEWKGRPVGVIFTRVIVVAWLVTPILLLHTARTEAQGIMSGEATPFRFQRANLESHLIQSGGEHLVIVDYGPNHSVFEEWVYNKADIDGSPIVWARDLEPEKNIGLIEYFADRKVWRLHVNGRDVSLRPYGSSSLHYQRSP